MSFRSFIVITIAIAIVACNRTEKVEMNEDGTVKKRTIYLNSDKSSYREIDYYDGKQIKGMHEFEDGLQHGRSFNYYPNGNIQSVFYYDKGNLTSIARHYNQSGKITDRGLFIDDSLVVKEEYFYKDDMVKVNIFSGIKGEFGEGGSLLYNSNGLFGMDNSYYYIVSSADSIPLTDSIKVDVNFIARNDNPSRIILSLGRLDENLNFLVKDKTYISDSLSTTFYYKPKTKGYNLILGKLLYIIKQGDKDQVNEFVFYHDFMAY
jgi:antitoxin component YwqK of YwqJK toxin-antitoxin module